MHNWRKSINISYKRWGNSKIRGEANFVGQSDEDQGTDNEICTVATAREGSGRRRSASRSTVDKIEETFTVDNVLENMGFGKFQWKMSLLTGLSWIGDAMEMMILSILGPQLHCEWKLPSYKVAVMTSAVFVGMGIGSPAWGTLIDKYGRRVGLIICSTWTLYFSLLSACAPVYGWLVFLRALVGFGLAGSPQSVTLYSEFLPVKSRGCYIMLIMVFWSAGTLLEVLLALWIMPTLGWRWLLGLSSVPLLIFVCSCIWLPESPRFDLLMGRTEKAMATLSRIAKDNGKNMPQGRVIASKQNERGRIKDLFISQYWKTTLPLCFIWFANAFSYYGIILLTTEMFQTTDSCWVTKGAKIEPHCSLECKYLTSDDYKDLLWTTLAEFPGLLIVLLSVDRLGRKKSMALCFFIFFLFVLPLYFCLERLSITIVIFIARAFISAGFQVAYVYTPEVFPTENRALAMGTCSAMGRVGSLITPFVSQLMLSVSVRFALLLNCGIALLAGFACLMLPIETLGRDLQESSPGNKAATQTTATTNHSTFF